MSPVEQDFNKLWDDALQRYEHETGKALLDLPLAKNFPSRPGNTDEVIEYLRKQTESFKDFRITGQKVLGVLKPIVHVVLLFLDATAEGASNMVPGGKAVFVAVGVLLQAAKGVSDLYDAIESLFRKVQGCLARVRTYLEPSSQPNPALKSILIETLIQVFTVLGIVTKYCVRATDSTSASRGKVGARVLLRRVGDYFRGILGHTDVKDALQKLEELTKEEQLMAAADTNAVVRKVNLKVDYIYNKAAIEDLRSWLNPPNQQPLNYGSKKRSNSCQWFFDEQFEEWKMGRGGVFWVYGNAGSGKSVLCSSVIDMLNTDPTLCLAYFYFDYSDSKKQDHRALVSSLVFQLGTGYAECLKYLQGERSPSPPTDAELLDMLSHLLTLSGRTYIVVDALDECPEHERDPGLLDFLAHLCDLAGNKSADVRLLVTSRPEPDIRHHMLPLAAWSLNFHDDMQHKGDLYRYVSSQLDRRDVYMWSDDIRARAQSALNEKANGMFLWVDLQLRYLKHCASDDIERTLNELPSDLNATYERILGDFKSSKASIERVRRAFGCIAFAKRPLSSTEVLEILSVDLGSPAKTSVVSDSLTTGIDDPESSIVRLCPGLIEVVISASGETVQFIHFSVQEYLMSPDLRNAGTAVHHYSFDEPSANLTLARISLFALDVDNAPLNVRSYADDHWDEHVSSCNENALVEPLRDFLNLDSPSFTRWVQIRHPNYEHMNTAFHCTARLGLCHHMKWMLTSPQNASSALTNVVGVRGGYEQTALHAAVSSGHADICRILVEHGALVDDAEEDGETPLHHATRSGSLDVTRFLLEHPAIDGSNAATLRCRVRGNNGQTALHTAAHCGRPEVCRLLIEHGALVDDVDNYGCTPLHYATVSGDFDTVRLLLQHPAPDGSYIAALRCRKRNEKGHTALHIAAYSGHVEICRLMLKHGALVDSADRYGHTPLQDAASIGSLEIVHLLLEHPATGDGSNTGTIRCWARNKQGVTALHRAAHNGHAEVCRILLEHGAVVDDADEDGETPLHDAVHSGDFDTIQLLLQQPMADGFDTAALRCQARDKHGRTALHDAAFRGDVEVCRLLIDNGALVDALDDEGKTPLHLAEEAGPEVARVLSEYGTTDGPHAESRLSSWTSLLVS